MSFNRVLAAGVLTLCAAVPVWAQGVQGQATGAATQAAAQTSAPEGLRPATTTIYGDTGLWFLSTGEILPAGRWSVSGYRVNYDREQGFSDISTWPVTFGVGVRDRAEIFGSVRLV
ncbi:MAG: hypothetical protein ACRD1Q_15415, partial [Vicinamibacterales bacterium]